MAEVDYAVTALIDRQHHGSDRAPPAPSAPQIVIPHKTIPSLISTISCLLNRKCLCPVRPNLTTSDILKAGPRMSPDEIERMMAEHRLYLETEYHQGHRPNFSSAGLAGRDFSGLNLRGIKMYRALLSGADFTEAHLQSANLIGAIAERACFDRADPSRVSRTFRQVV